MAFFNTIIIGAGAAGLMAATTAARRGSVLIIEKMEKAARKVRITGKGRCNITNTKSAEDFLAKVRSGADFFSYAFEHFDNKATMEFFEKSGLELNIERGDRVFPASGRAWDVAQTLVDAARKSGATIEYNLSASRINTRNKRVCSVECTDGSLINCNNVIIATGGLAYPATGSTGDGYGMAYDLGHNIEPVRPSLTPLESNSPLIERLAGTKLINVNVSLLIDGIKRGSEFGEMEFTEFGVGGAIILRLSRIAVDALIDKRKVELSIDIKPALSKQQLEARIEREIATMRSEEVITELIHRLAPTRLVRPLLSQARIPSMLHMRQMDSRRRSTIIDTLKDIRLEISGYRPFEEAVVTAGGVDLRDVEQTTLESRLIKGLFFAGEVLDIDADTGGYNLQIAFSTGHLAGSSVQEDSRKSHRNTTRPQSRFGGQKSESEKRPYDRKPRPASRRGTDENGYSKPRATSRRGSDENGYSKPRPASRRSSDENGYSKPRSPRRNSTKQ